LPVFVIPTEVEKSLTISVVGPLAETLRDVSTWLEMTKRGGANGLFDVEQPCQRTD